MCSWFHFALSLAESFKQKAPHAIDLDQTLMFAWLAQDLSQSQKARPNY